MPIKVGPFLPPVLPQPLAPNPAPAPLRLSLPVTRTDLALAARSIQLLPNARPKPVLSASDILAASPERQTILLDRHARFLALLAGSALGTTAVDTLSPGRLARGPYVLEVIPGQIAISARTPDGAVCRLTLDVAEPGKVGLHASGGLCVPSLEAAKAFALSAFEHLLLRDGAQAPLTAADIEPAAARALLFLLGARATIKPPDVTQPKAKFQTPKLIAWDFNGTVERDGAARAGLQRATAALNHMGALNVLTTSASPEKPEKFLEHHAISFGAFFGGKEVRPNDGHKQYAGIAASYGLDASTARHQLAVVGDSVTDAPSDLPGVVFFHVPEDTPAPALEHVLAELDARGGGSLARGLDALLGGALVPGQLVQASVGPVRFQVTLVNGGSAAAPCLCPAIHAIVIDLDRQAVAEQLAAMVTSNEGATSLQRLAAEHAAGALDERELAPLLADTAGAPHAAAARAAVVARLERRQADVTQARHIAADLPALLARPLPWKSVVGLFAELAGTGDAVVARFVTQTINDFAAITAVAAATSAAVLTRDRDTIKAWIAHAGRATNAATALPAWRARDWAKPATEILQAILSDPLPLDADERKQVLDALGTLTLGPQDAPLLAQLDAALEVAHDRAQAIVAGLMTERVQRANELDAAVPLAHQAARERTATWQTIAAQLSA